MKSYLYWNTLNVSSKNSNAIFLDIDNWHRETKNKCCYSMQELPIEIKYAYNYIFIKKVTHLRVIYIL